jgi:hypothetical protein
LRMASHSAWMLTSESSVLTLQGVCACMRVSARVCVQMCVVCCRRTLGSEGPWSAWLWLWLMAMA